MTYGTRIKQGREDRRMTQEQLAEELDVSRQAVSKWEMDLSRPARGKLERLSEVLDIPMEVWAEIDAEQAAAERPPDTAGPWKLAAGILAALCLTLAAVLTAVLWRQAHPNTPAEIDEAPPPGQEAGFVPETLALTVRHDFEFGDIPLGDYDRDLVPYIDDPAEVLEHALWEDTFADGVRICLAETHANWNPVWYHIYVLYAFPGEDWQILYRIVEDLSSPWDCQPEAEAFTNVLGQDGFKLTLYRPTWEGWDSTYLGQREDGTPRMMAALWNRGQEADVDEDGELEIVFFDQNGPSWQIADTAEGEEGGYFYTLPCLSDAQFRLDFDGQQGGFVVRDSGNVLLYRYVLRDGEMVRIPKTDFTAADWPDVAKTRIEFVLDDGYGLSDGLEPDAILPNAGHCITHRQQAYLALQELYNLTGLTVDECFCAAGEFFLCFSLLPDGFNQRSFLLAGFGEAYGGLGIPHLNIAWKEQPGCEWSPLSFAEAVHPLAEREHLLAWYYDRLTVFRTDPWSYETDGEFPENRNLYVAGGDLFVGTFCDTEWGPILIDLLGPYPGGEVHH